MWLWLIQRDLECIYTFASVPATLLYYPNFYCKNPLSAIWWSTDFWGLTCFYCYNWYQCKSGRSFIQDCWKVSFQKIPENALSCSSFTVAVSILCTTNIPRCHWFVASAAVKRQKYLFFASLQKITRRITFKLCKSITLPNPIALDLSFYTTLGDSFV